MINPFADINWNPDLAERRKFAHAVTLGFYWIVVALILFGRLRTGVWPNFSAVIAAGSLVSLTLILAPRFTKPFYIAWYCLGASIGIVISNLLFTAFFYLIVTPTGLVMRALGRDPLRRKLDRAGASYWRDVEKVADPERYFRQF